MTDLPMPQAEAKPSTQDPYGAIAEREAERVAAMYPEIEDRDYFTLALMHAALDAVTAVRPLIIAAGRAQAAADIREALKVTGDDITDWQRGYRACATRALAVLAGGAEGDQSKEQA